MQEKYFQHKSIVLLFTVLMSACNSDLEPEVSLNYDTNSLGIKIPEGYYLDNYTINDEGGNVAGRLRKNVCHSSEDCSRISSVEIKIGSSDGALILSEVLTPANLSRYWGEEMNSQSIGSLQSGKCYALNGMIYMLDVGERKKMDGMFSKDFCLNEIGQLNK